MVVVPPFEAFKHDGPALVGEHPATAGPACWLESPAAPSPALRRLLAESNFSL
jgi:hypothetical protein